MKLSCFYIMTEPEKMGFPYMETIISSLSICDEVVLVIGRDEKKSDKKINNLKSFLEKNNQSDKLKVVRTRRWPESDWHYDVMRDHLQIGLDACTGDLCMKIDADHVFRNQHAELIRQNLIKFGTFHHYTPINLVHFYSHNVASFRSQMRRDLANCYIVNKKKLKEDGLSCKIINDKGSNRPAFFEKNGKEHKDVLVGLLGDFSDINEENQAHLIKIYSLCIEIFAPINYSYTFCDKKQIARYWSRWFKARNMKFGTDKEFEYDDLDSSFNYFLKYYHEKKIPKRKLKDSAPKEEHGRVYGFTTIAVSDQASCPYLYTNNAITFTPSESPEKTDLKFALENHPLVMQKKLMTLDKNMWGYDNFLKEWEKVQDAG